MIIAMETFELVARLSYKSTKQTQTYNLESIEEGRNILKDHIVYKDEDMIRVFNRKCDHQGGKLCDHNGRIVCPLHGWEFSPEKGGYENVQLKK